MVIEYWNHCNGKQCEQEYESKEEFVKIMDMKEADPLYHTKKYKDKCEQVPAWDWLAISVDSEFCEEGATIEDVVDSLRCATLKK